MPQRKKAEKRCSYCGDVKKRAEFYENKGCISAYCKICTMQRRKKEGRPAYLKAIKKYRKNHAERHRQYMRENGAKYREKYRKEGKIRARWMARYYLDRQPCERCGSVKSQAHHHDYTKPLDVNWLCSTHHAEIHNDH
jgi:hypothetical protein